jgi:hypothetical protein
MIDLTDARETLRDCQDMLLSLTHMMKNDDTFKRDKRVFKVTLDHLLDMLEEIKFSVEENFGR